MNRWMHAAPPHRDPWRRWLTYPGSLTRRIIERYGAMEVRIVAQGLRRVSEDERAALGLPPHALAYVREVVLHVRGRPVVLAHSIAVPRHVGGEWRGLRGLGTRPLAELLFRDPKVRRAPFEYARLGEHHRLARRAREVFGRRFPPLRARRSIFHRRGRPLMVTEVFLPALREPDR